MPVKYKRPEWEKVDNRTRIYAILLERSLTFTELLNETGFARSTLTNHLNDLMEYEAIEKAFEIGHVVYRATIDEKIIESELKKWQYDWIQNFLTKSHPSIGIFLDAIMKILIKELIWFKQRKIEGNPPSRDEQIKKILELSKIEFTPEYIQNFQKDPEGLKLLENFFANRNKKSAPTEGM